MPIPERDAAIADILHRMALPQGVQIRAWRDDDQADIARLSAAEGWPSPIERPRETHLAWQSSWPSLVAEAEGNVVGFVRTISDGAITAYVAELLIDPVWRARGVGAMLLDVVHELTPVPASTCWPPRTVRRSMTTWGFGVSWASDARGVTRCCSYLCTDKAAACIASSNAGSVMPLYSRAIGP